MVQKAYDYYPFGLQLQATQAGHEATFTFTNKQLDQDGGLDWYYFGARFYDAEVGRFLGVDPLAGKYPALNPYHYTMNNPLIYVDPDGRFIEFANGSTPEFRRNFANAVNYLNSNGAGGILADLHSSNTVYYVSENSGISGSFFKPESKTIYWNPQMAVGTSEGVIMSPTAVLNHEADHANQYDEKPEQYRNDLNTEDAEYGTKEEKRVIEGSEQATANKLGEISEGQVTRKDHHGSGIIVSGPTSTDPIGVIQQIPNYKEEEER